jgi:hypothetical protein
MEDRNLGAPGPRAMARRRTTPAASSSLKPVLKPAAPASSEKPTGRHAAIRNALPTLASYRSWSAKARTDWEKK